MPVGSLARQVEANQGAVLAQQRQATLRPRIHARVHQVEPGGVVEHVASQVYRVSGAHPAAVPAAEHAVASVDRDVGDSAVAVPGYTTADSDALGDEGILNQPGVRVRPESAQIG